MAKPEGVNDKTPPVLPSCSATVADQMRLIITEKNNSAQKIAEILSAGKATETKSFTVPVFRWTDGDDGETAVVGTGGHAVERAFPEGKEYKQWKLELIPGLIDAPLITRPTDGKKNVVKAVQKEAKSADTLVIATDFDRQPRTRADRQAGPLLGADQRRDRRCLFRPVRAFLPTGQRRRRPTGHRPDLGRSLYPGGLTDQQGLRGELPFGRPGPEPDSRPDRRA